MKRLHFASMKLMCVFSMSMVPVVLFAADKNPQRPRIEIPTDHEEVIILDNGKEVQRRRVEKHSEEGHALLRDVDKEVFKTMGVNSKREIIQQKRWQEYTSELSKRMEVVEIPAVTPDRVRFINEKGALRKEVKIGQETKQVAMKNFVDEMEKNAPLDDFNKADLRKFRKERPDDKLKVNISRLAYANKPKDYLALIENQYVTGIENSDEFFRITVAGKIIYMDVAGKELWQKYFKDGETILGIGHSDGTQISDNGDVVTVMTTASEGGPGEEQLHVFNKLGNEIFTYPKDGETITAPHPSDHKISSNGRYLCYRIEKRANLTEPPSRQININKDEESNKAAILEKLKKTHNTVFWDLMAKTTWETEAYLVYEISNDGIAKVGNPWASGGSRLLDLKPSLKKP